MPTVAEEVTWILLSKKGKRIKKQNLRYMTNDKWQKQTASEKMDILWP